MAPSNPGSGSCAISDSRLCMLTNGQPHKYANRPIDRR
jgi:hypothetical protein